MKLYKVTITLWSVTDPGDYTDEDDLIDLAHAVEEKLAYAHGWTVERLNPRDDPDVDWLGPAAAAHHAAHIESFFDGLVDVRDDDENEDEADSEEEDQQYLEDLVDDVPFAML